MKRQNYRVHAYVGRSSKALTRMTVVIDTGAGSSFIRKDTLPDSIQSAIQPYHLRSNIRDANNRRVQIAGTVKLAVRIGHTTDNINFNVVERLGTEVIIGCDYLDKHVEAIRPRQRRVEMDDGTTVPIVRCDARKQALNRDIPEDTPHLRRPTKFSRRIRVTSTVVLKPNTQTWVEVTTETSGLILVESTKRLCETHTCLTGNGVAQVEANKPFRVLVANFGNTNRRLLSGQAIAFAEPHPSSIMESDVSHAELLGLVDDKTAQLYRKRNLNARDTSVINDYLRDARSGHMGVDEKPTTAADIQLPDVHTKHHPNIRKMLSKYEDMWSGRLGDISVTEHHIDLVDGARPFKTQPYRAGPKARELVQFEIDKQLEAGVIEPSMSEWAAPVLFVPKKDGKLRFCIDYRKLNSMTVKDSYPIPRMDECIDTLGEARVFSTLDAYSGYWQMNVAKKDRPKTAFVCHSGTFQCKRMPFGLTNAPATFQRALDLILTKYKWQTCLVYLDDVIIFSTSVEEHIRHVDEVLSCLSSAGVTLKISKCHFFTTTVEYLGHIIKPGQLEIDQANTKSLREALPPSTRTQLRSFLGLVNVYRRFIPNFSTVAGPLNELLKKDAPTTFELVENQQQAFQTLIDAVLSPAVLALPQSGLPYSVDTDASAYGIGCALFQTHPDGTRKPIGFWSRSLTDAERNYSTPERECLGVVWALKTLRAYLLYETFIVHSDQAALRWLMEIQEPSGRLMRWRLRLSEYDFQVMYKQGHLNTQADALSRLHTLAETVHEDWDEIPAFTVIEYASDYEHLFANTPLKKRFKHPSPHNYDDEQEDILDLSDVTADAVFATLPEPKKTDPLFSPITHEELVTAQLSDPFCTDVRRKLNEGVVLPFGFSEDGLLCRQVSHEQIVVPHILKARVLHIHHYARLAGHPGGRKQYMGLKRHMYWPAMAVDCYATARKCSTCAKNRIKLRLKTNPLQLFPPSGPLESVAIDIFGPLLKTGKGNQYLLVICDRFTKLTKTVPLRGVTAGEVARAFTHEWIMNYGSPLELLSDNGKCFTSKFFQSVCSIMNVDTHFTTTYHPQTNGQVERYNRTLKAAIKSYLDDHPKDWDLYTPALTYAYNCQPHSSTSLAPFELVLSRPPTALAIQARQSTPASALESNDKWRAWLSKTLAEAKGKLAQAQARYKRNYDKRLRRHRERIQKDDTVFLRVERRDESLSRHKLAAVAEGPFVVDSVKGNTVVILRSDGSVERVSRDRVTLAPTQISASAAREIVRPLTDEELDPGAFPVDEDINLNDIITKPDPSVRSDDFITPAIAEDNPVDPTNSLHTDIRTVATNVTTNTQLPSNASTPRTQPSNANTRAREIHEAVPQPQPTRQSKRIRNRRQRYQNVRTQTTASTRLPHNNNTSTQPQADIRTDHSDETTANPSVTTVPKPPAPALTNTNTTVIATHGTMANNNTTANTRVHNTHEEDLPTSTTNANTRHSTDPTSSLERPSKRRSKRIHAQRNKQSNRSTQMVSNTRAPITSTHPIDNREYVIDRILGHDVNNDNDHPTARVGETVYRIRWYGHDEDEDTFEPIHHLPRNKLVSYYRQKQLPLPPDIRRSMAG